MRKNRIDLLSPPFKGHLHPVLAMAKQLKRAGYEVTVFSSAAAKPDIEAAGIQAQVLTSVDDAALTQCVNPPVSVGSSPLRLYSQFKQVITFFSALKLELEAIYESRHTDLVICDFTLPVVGVVANKHSIPWWTSMPSPCVLECIGGTPSYLGGWKPGESGLIKLRDWFGRKLVRLFKKTVFTLCKKKIRSLGILAIYRQNGTEAIYSNERILCIGYKEFEFPRPWPISVKFIGPMLYSPDHHCDGNSLAQPKFQHGKRYTLVTLGTHLNWCKASVYREIERLSNEFPEMVFHFTEGNSATSDFIESNDRCYKFSYINYEEYLSNYDYVIHHGGAGIMYYCLKYKKPSIVIPQDYDQFDHAARLESLGFSIWLKGKKNLAVAFRELITDCNIVKNIDDFNAKETKHYDGREFVSLVKEALR